MIMTSVNPSNVGNKTGHRTGHETIQYTKKEKAVLKLVSELLFYSFHLQSLAKSACIIY